MRLFTLRQKQSMVIPAVDAAVPQIIFLETMAEENYRVLEIIALAHEQRCVDLRRVKF
jgi:hypothetical protein